MGSKLREMALAPNIKSGEEIFYSAEIGEHSKKSNMICVLTNLRFILGPIKGEKEPLLQDRSLQIDLKDIRSIRDKMAFVSGRVILETETDIHTLPKMKKESAEELRDFLINVTGFVKSDWEKEGQSAREKQALGGLAATLGGLGIIGSIFMGLFGVVFILTGVLFTLTIIGAIIGVPLMWFGGGLLSMAAGIGSFGLGTGLRIGSSISDGQREWVHPDSIDMDFEMSTEEISNYDLLPIEDNFGRDETAKLTFDVENLTISSSDQYLQTEDTTSDNDSKQSHLAVGTDERLLICDDNNMKVSLPYNDINYIEEEDIGNEESIEFMNWTDRTYLIYGLVTISLGVSLITFFDSIWLLLIGLSFIVSGILGLLIVILEDNTNDDEDNQLMAYNLVFHLFDENTIELTLSEDSNEKVGQKLKYLINFSR